MKADTVLVDLNEVKVGFWDRLSNLSQDGETTIKDLLIELRSQISIVKGLENNNGSGEELRKQS
jgi:hypothetical protein